jgi:hypothetical protein
VSGFEYDMKKISRIENTAAMLVNVENNDRRIKSIGIMPDITRRLAMQPISKESIRVSVE